MKTKLFASLLLFPFLSFAQQSENADPAAQTMITIEAGFTGLQAGAELAVTKKSTVQFRGGVLPLLYNPAKYIYGAEPKWVAGLSFSGEFRHYYNFERRLEKGKDVTNNGANYVGFMALYLTKPLGKNNDLAYATSAIIAGPMWGFNRPLGSRVLFHLDLGPVLQHEISNENTAVTLYGDVRFAVKLN
jgi:hypothetical protein